MRKIGSIQSAGHPCLTVYYDDKAERNPFRVYHEWYESGRHRKKQINRYADLFSCGVEIKDYTERYNHE